MIGGTGPESTIAYYRAVTDGVQGVLGVGHLPSLSIESVSVFEVLRLCTSDDYDGLTEYLSSAIRRLAAAGAELATLTGLTPHIVLEGLRAASPIPVISAIDAAKDAALKRGTTTLLLGTEFTMTRDFFLQPLRSAGLRVVVPNAGEIAYMQKKIVDELEHGIVVSETRAAFVSIISRLREEEGAQQVMLGCTELPLLLDDTTSPLPCIDVVEEHCQVLVRAITGQD